MLSLVKRLKSARRSHVSTILAGLAVAAAPVLFVSREKEENEDEEKHDASSYTSYGVLPWNKPRIVDCEAALLSLPRLRRLPTVKKLEETATEDRLETHYRVNFNEPLGQGAFGAVFAAQHRITGEKVAVKQIDKKHTSNAAFQREMEALLLLRQNGGHPNICGMRENFDEGDSFYIVMDLVSGNEMFDELCCAGPYSEADAARHIQEIGSALAFCHGLDVSLVHSDIKPENLMLSSKDADDAVIKLVDFGCAHLASHAPFQDHQQKGTANTPAYCPPEVLLEARKAKHRHVTIEPSFDMWSLGVVIYIMLVGAHPFDLDGQSTDEEIEERIISGEKLPLRDFEFSKHLSEDAMALIEGLLEFDPQKRLTAEQVLENRWVRGETASSKKITGSDKRLAAYRKYKTRIGSAFFRALLSHNDAIHVKTPERISLLESAFHQLDTEKNGYLSTSAIQGKNSSLDTADEDAKLSYSDVSSLLAENMKHRYFPKGHLVYSEGDCGDSMFLIDSGTVEVTTEDGYRKLRVSGDLFGEGAMRSDNKTHSSTIRCVTPVHVLEIPRELFGKYIASDTEAFLNMAERERHRRRERANTILRLNKKCQQQWYKRGETIFRAGDKSGDLYLLEDGEIEISVHGHKVRSLHQGEMTGEHAAYFGKPYNVTAQCVSNSCGVKALPSKVMHDLFRSDPSLRQDFRDLLLRRDFKKALCAATKRSFPTTEQEIRAAFDDIDKEESGEIAFDQLRTIVRQFDPTYNEEDIRGMLDSLDLNQSGSLTWEEFHRIFAMDKEA